MKSQHATIAVILVIVFLLLSFGMELAPNQAAVDTPRAAPGMESVATLPSADSQHVLIQLGHFTDDLHAAFMAVKIGVALRSAGAEVTLFANLEGIRALDSRQPLNMRWGHSKTFATYYDEFVAKGGRVLGCPHCAQAAGIDEDRLRESARIATENEVAGMILGADKILDY